MNDMTTAFFYIGVPIVLVLLLVLYFIIKKRKTGQVSVNEAPPFPLSLQQITNLSDDLMILCNEQNEILHMNTALQTFFNLGDSVLGQTLQGVLPKIYAALQSRQKTSFQTLVALEKENVLYDYMLKVKPVVYPVFSGYMIYMTSYQEHLQLEKELSNTKTSTQDIIKAKNMFLANMSHELRTPLNAIIGMSELLIDTDLAPTEKDLIHSINQSASILYDIINTILDFSKLEANQMGLENVSMDVSKILEEIEAVFTHSASVKKIDLKFNKASGVPIVNGDPVRLRQILVNIIGNAIKFTHLGSVTVNVRVKNTDRNKVYLEFSITDTGIGFPSEMKDKIFDPFIQEDDSITRKFGGTGLGLPICKSLVQLHGGELSVQSAVGKGSVFTITLPYTIAADNQNYDYKKVVAKPTVSAKILVAEDNLTNQKLLSMQLRNLNYDVNIVENGQQAVEEYFENDYDIIIMDCQMPIMDGFCATLIIRQQEELFNRHIPIVALTASALKEDKEKCLECGMDDYITKPVKIETLHNTLQQWLTAAKSNENR
ncbi:MAG: response regulator [Vallitaleaceae bacterium]|nr:response regulator [Vallitaleaceae bacterium]